MMTHTSNNSGPLDLAELRRRFQGKGDLLRRMIRILGDQTPPLLARISEAARLGDARALEWTAHTLRGSLLQFGAFGAATLAQELEQAAAGGVVTQADVMAEKLKVQTADIQQILNNLSKSPDL